MKKKLFMIVVCFGFMSCQNELWDKINELQSRLDNLDGRVARLEELCKEMNTNINALQTIVDVILNNDYIINVTPITKDGVEIGYTITFAQHTPITIYNGTNGNDGADGNDGITPQISVRLDSDGAYYWTLNGEWMLTPEGERIPVTSRDGRPGADGEDGIDGADGEDGLDGQDGITPQLKIENDYWYVSYDEGKTWIQLGKAKGEDGKDGQDGADGQNGKDGTNGENGKDGIDGKNGKDGDSMFTSVTQDETKVYFILADGQTFTIPKVIENTTYPQPVENGHIYIDLGLPSGVMWSACNIGGYYPNDYGHYFVFGSIIPNSSEIPSDFTINGLKLENGNSIAGSKYDAAKAQWGGKWQIPSKSEWDELLSNCTIHYSGSGSVILKSKINGASITFPLDNTPYINQAIVYQVAHIYEGKYISATYTGIGGYYISIKYEEKIKYNGNNSVNINTTLTHTFNSNGTDLYMMRPIFQP